MNNNNMAQRYKVAVSGITGRMGRLMVDAVNAHSQLCLSLGLIRVADRNVRLLDENNHDVPLSQSDWLSACYDNHIDVIVDFTSAESALSLATISAELGIRLVTGSTGLNQEQIRALKHYGQQTLILHDSNMSIMMQWVLHLAQESASFFPYAEVDIHDEHHRYKKDAPSGTANQLAGVVVRARNRPHPYRLDKAGPRPEGTIDFSITRSGEHTSKHAISFTTTNESFSIAHHTDDRTPYIDGAIQAILFLLSHTESRQGFFNMQDMLSLKGSS